MSNLGSRVGSWMSEMWQKLQRTKQIGSGTDLMETQLRRCLSTFDIVLLGIGHMVGSGAYVLTSSVARNIAGPAIVLSFIISGFASFLSALCYAEFAGRFPKCGSAYSCEFTHIVPLILYSIVT
jgi:cationic amino acid transporter 4